MQNHEHCDDVKHIIVSFRSFCTNVSNNVFFVMYSVHSYGSFSHLLPSKVNTVVELDTMRVTCFFIPTSFLAGLSVTCVIKAKAIPD